ncbi:hypothetical protein, partial [Dendronalium sp. ChiSLP03b]|uniref:hypothetical protein n=1 Tax=Dendronalium sp. ChiSLP03b TaxID=3075381 RepID=UPI0039191A09
GHIHCDSEILVFASVRYSVTLYLYDLSPLAYPILYQLYCTILALPCHYDSKISLHINLRVPASSAAIFSSSESLNGKIRGSNAHLELAGLFAQNR